MNLKMKTDKMKTFRCLLMAAAAASLMCGCTKERGYEDNTEPELHLYQIAGTWQLTSWNGREIGDDEPYCYIILTSKDNAFEIYQNIDSPYSRHITGNFSLSYDEDSGINTISGWYDYNAGLWASDYAVSAVTSDSMTWTSENDVCVYTRRSAVPDDIVAGTKSL